jgi:hypothetical protein
MQSNTAFFKNNFYCILLLKWFSGFNGYTESPFLSGIGKRGFQDLKLEGK